MKVSPIPNVGIQAAFWRVYTERDKKHLIVIKASFQSLYSDIGLS